MTYCIKEPVVTGKDVTSYREAMKMTQDDFAKGCNVSLGRLKEIEAMPGNISNVVSELGLNGLLSSKN